MSRPRRATPADVPVLAALNDAAVPAVNALGESGLRDHLPRCDLALVVDGPDGPLAFMLALAPGSDYASENYAWFSRHRPGSLYVDRVVVSPHARGTGLGRRLYLAAERVARDRGLTEITCEVNLEPPNPQSLAFHERLGFRRVGVLETKGGSVHVALLAKALRTAARPRTAVRPPPRPTP